MCIECFFMHFKEHVVVDLQIHIPIFIQYIIDHTDNTIQSEHFQGTIDSIPSQEIIKRIGHFLEQVDTELLRHDRLTISKYQFLSGSIEFDGIEGRFEIENVSLDERRVIHDLNQGKYFCSAAIIPSTMTLWYSQLSGNICLLSTCLQMKVNDQQIIRGLIGRGKPLQTTVLFDLGILGQLLIDLGINFGLVCDILITSKCNGW